MRLPKFIARKMDPVEVHILDKMHEAGEEIKVNKWEDIKYNPAEDIRNALDTIERMATKKLPDFYVHDAEDKEKIIEVAFMKLLSKIGEDGVSKIIDETEVKELSDSIGILPQIKKGNIYVLNSNNPLEPPRFFCSVDYFRRQCSRTLSTPQSTILRNEQEEN